MATATLGIQIESSGATKAAADLDKFAQSAGRAEAATAKVTSNVVPFRRAVDGLGDTTRQTANTMRNLSFQVNDIATGLASGQSPFQILAQQGGQVYQVLQMGPGGVGGSLRAVGATIASMITPTRLLVAGLAGLGVAGLVAASNWKSFALAIDDLARSANTSTSAMAALQAAAGLKGIGAEDFAGAMQGFARATYDAKNGAGDLLKVLQWNGQAAGDLEQNLASVATIIGRAKDDTLLQFSILRQSGLPATMEMVRWMENYESTLQRAKDITRSVGSDIDQHMTAKAREFADQWDAAWVSFSASARSSVISAAALLQTLGDKVRDFYSRQLGPDKLGAALLAGGSGNRLTATSNVDALYGKLLSSKAQAIDPQVMQRSIDESMKLTDQVNDLAKGYVSIGHAAREARPHVMRLHDESERSLRRLTSAASEFATSLVEGFAQGGNAAEVLSRSLQGLSSDLIRIGSQEVIGGLTKALSGGGAAFGGFNTTGGVTGSQGGGGLLSGISGMLGLAGPLGSLAGGALAIGGGLIANLFGGGGQKKQQQQQQAMQQALQAQQAQQQKTIQAEEAAMSFRFQAATMGIDTRTQAGAMAKLEADIARERADAAKLGGNAIIAYEELAQAKRLQLEKEWAEKAESIRRDYLDREFAALNDTSTLSGKLAEYEHKAAREREDAVRNGGIALIELDRAQAAERVRILKDASKEITDYYGGLRSTISDFTRGLQFGATSTLSPAEQFLAARNDFQNQLAAAQGGDRTAQGGITQVAQTLIEQARSYLGPSVEFGNIVSRITDQLGALPDIAMANDPQVQELQRLGYDYLSPINDEISGMRAEQKALTSQVVNLMLQNNEQSDVIAELLRRLGLDLRQGLQSIEIRAA